MRLVVDIFVKGRKIRALMDSGAKADCIRRRTALELDLIPLPGKATPLMSPEGSRIHSYSNHNIRMTAKDTMGESRTTAIILISCDFDIKGINIILGFLALKAMCVVIDFANHE